MASSQGKFYALLGAVLVAGVALIGYVAVNKNRRAVADAAETAAALPAMLAEGELVGEDVGVAMGPEDAPVIIHEYADYQCPYCGMVATLTLPQIFEEYVQTGKARFVFFDYPLNPGASEIGAEAARCAIDQDAFWAMQKVLFGRMQEWGTKPRVRRRPGARRRRAARVHGLAQVPRCSDGEPAAGAAARPQQHADLLHQRTARAGGQELRPDEGDHRRGAGQG